MWKIALRPIGTLNSYNFGTVEDTDKLFAPNRGFSGSASLMVSFKLTPDQPMLPWQPVVAMKHKISYNSDCTEDMHPISVSVKRGLRVFYPQNLGQDAQKMKAVRQRAHIISFMTHKFKLPYVRLTR